MDYNTYSEIERNYENAVFTELDVQFVAQLEDDSIRNIALEMSAAARMIAEAMSFEQTLFPEASSKNRILTVLHSCLPWLPGGYSGRAHGIMQYLARQDIVSLAVTRAGFLNDMKSGLNTEDHPFDFVDSVMYQHIDSPVRRGDGEYQYMEQAIDQYCSVITNFRPTLVHVRSSYPSALPALIAAKRFGIPVIYEVSGLWELVFEGRGEQGAARRAKTLESAVVNAADRVVTLTKSMKVLLEQEYAKGVNSEVSIAPNAVDIELFQSKVENQSQANDCVTVGYVGSLLDYEGVDLLVRAIVRLVEEGRSVRGLVVGGGPELSRIKELVSALAADAYIDIRGSVPAEQVPYFYEKIDICPFPRYSTPATEAVSPLKPFEAMAMEKPIVVSSVGALQEIVSASQAGLVFDAGNLDSLVESLRALVDSPDARTELGSRGRDFVEKNHTWEIVGNEIFNALIPAAYSCGEIE